MPTQVDLLPEILSAWASDFGAPPPAPPTRSISGDSRLKGDTRWPDHHPPLNSHVRMCGLNIAQVVKGPISVRLSTPLLVPGLLCISMIHRHTVPPWTRRRTCLSPSLTGNVILTGDITAPSPTGPGFDARPGSRPSARDWVCRIEELFQGWGGVGGILEWPL